MNKITATQFAIMVVIVGAFCFLLTLLVLPAFTDQSLGYASIITGVLLMIGGVIGSRIFKCGI